MIVDSLIGKSGPAAMEYLHNIGVRDEHVKHIVVTHWHRDHYEGIDELHDRYGSACLWVTAAMRHETFITAYARDDRNLCRVGQVMVRANRRQITAHTPGLATLMAGVTLIDRPTCRIKAIAPTVRAYQAACAELADVIVSPTKVRSALRRDNRCSVALHVEIGGAAAFLCGDVETNPPAYGWVAVLEDPRHESLSPASLVKVPHHGSQGAYYEPFWDAFVTPDATMLVAPYTSLKDPIPTQQDCAQLLARGRLWQTAPSFRVRRDLGTDDGVVQRTGKSPIGLVQARRRVDGNHSWQVRAEPPAFEVSGDCP